MVVFHLAYIGDEYPYVKQVVYTFHMPAFLIISGYLANIRKEKKTVYIVNRMDFYSICNDGNRVCCNVINLTCT